MKISSHFSIWSVLLLSVAAASCTQTPPAAEASEESARQENLEFLNPGQSFSDAVRAGNLLFLTGKLGRSQESQGITAETRLALERIKDAVERYGSSMDRVVKCTVFLADMAEWSDMNQVYQTFFPSNPPARSAVGVGVSGLYGGARVEIECIAAV